MFAKVWINTLRWTKIIVFLRRTSSGNHGALHYNIHSISKHNDQCVTQNSFISRKSHTLVFSNSFRDFWHQPKLSSISLHLSLLSVILTAALPSCLYFWLNFLFRLNCTLDDLGHILPTHPLLLLQNACY